MHTQAAILQLDGLLLDTERIAREAWTQVAEESGISISHALVASMVGRRTPDITAFLAEHMGSAEHASRLMAHSNVHDKAMGDERPVAVKAEARLRPELAGECVGITLPGGQRRGGRPPVDARRWASTTGSLRPACKI